MRLIFLRHAHTAWNSPPKVYQGRTDVPLSEQGRASARDLAPGFPAVEIVYSSPARRCLQTIDAIFGSDLPRLYTDERLWEMDMGYFSGMQFDQVEARYSREHNIWRNRPADIRPGDGETLGELRQRLVAFLEHICRPAKTREDVLVVTHGGPIRMLHCLAEQCDMNEFHKFSVPNLSRLAVTLDRAGNPQIESG